MKTLPARVLLVVSISLSSLELYHDTPFWPAEFLLKSQLLAYGNCFVHNCCFFLAAFNTLFLLLIIFWCSGYRWGPLLVDPFGSSLCFLALHVCFLSQVREAFSHCVFEYVLSFFWDCWLLCMMSQRYLKPSSSLSVLYAFCCCRSDI